eukprot:6207435-Pleurochrysis_carterae.AAC.6
MFFPVLIFRFVLRCCPCRSASRHCFAVGEAVSGGVHRWTFELHHGHAEGDQNVHAGAGLGVCVGVCAAEVRNRDCCSAV